MNKENAEDIIDYVVTKTKPRWIKWIYESYSKLDEILITRGYEQGGFAAGLFFKILGNKDIANIMKLGSILERYKGEDKYNREEKGSLKSPFYRDLARGIYHDYGKAFYECVEKFSLHPDGNQGFMFWMKLWQMLVCCRHLKQNYQSSFRFYLKKKYSDYIKISEILDKDFFNITLEDWKKFLKKTTPWNELYGIGDNVFDYLVRDIKEFDFNKESFKLDAANKHFFKTTGISKLCDIQKRDNVIKFLKELNLKHKYSIKEINTGIYIYCSDTEKENFGFCRNMEKCTECKVNSICEKNL